MLNLFNSLSRKVEEFKPINPPNVGMYTCGMTVYDYAHIGHGRKYVGDDILRRILTRFGYKIKHVQNVTDVGHLVSDADEGEDKLEKGAKKVGKTVWEVAAFFTKHFYDSMDKLNILRPDIICKATDHIKEQTAFVEKLIATGFAYETPEAVYFDISKFAGYGKLFGQKLEEKKTAVREEVKTGEHKKHPADFALWFKRVGRFSNHTMYWPSPWGEGFPGWHIECSAMSMKYLGDTFDIHTGGIDHIPVHHPNEIAQSEGATGKQFVNYWVHHAFLMVDGKKMSKSLGNIYTIEDVINEGFDPLALRYFYFTAHYRSPQNFTWEALRAAQSSLNELREQIASIKNWTNRTLLSNEKLEKIDDFRKRFDMALEDDINMPAALAVIWSVVKSNISSSDKYDFLTDADEILGLNLRDVKQEESHVFQGSRSGISITSNVVLSGPTISQIDERELARNKVDFKTADDLRKEIEKEGFTIKDTPGGTVVKK